MTKPTSNGVQVTDQSWATMLPAPELSSGHRRYTAPRTETRVPPTAINTAFKRSRRALVSVNGSASQAERTMSRTSQSAPAASKGLEARHDTHGSRCFTEGLGSRLRQHGSMWVTESTRICATVVLRK